MEPPCGKEVAARQGRGTGTGRRSSGYESGTDVAKHLPTPQTSGKQGGLRELVGTEHP